MAASLGDLLQIVDNQTYLGQDLMNVYYFRVVSITGLTEGYLEAIDDWFTTNIMNRVRPFQGNGLIHTTLRTTNLSNNIDFYEEVKNLAGQEVPAAGAAAPSFVAVNFKLIRESLATRNGSKRYAGLIEEKMSGNSYSFSGSVQADLEAALASDIVIGLATIAEPVIVRRPIDPPVGTSYTYSSIGAAAYTGLGTQNTRKP